MHFWSGTTHFSTIWDHSYVLDCAVNFLVVDLDRIPKWVMKTRRAGLLRTAVAYSQWPQCPKTTGIQTDFNLAAMSVQGSTMQKEVKDTKNVKKGGPKICNIVYNSELLRTMTSNLPANMPEMSGIRAEKSSQSLLLPWNRVYPKLYFPQVSTEAPRVDCNEYYVGNPNWKPFVIGSGSSGLPVTKRKSSLGWTESQLHGGKVHSL